MKHIVGTSDQGRGADPRHAPDPSQWRVREVTKRDAKLLFSWRNNSGDLHSTRTGSPVSWADHVRWIEASIDRRDRIVLVISDELADIGTVRWDERAPGQWEVSITVAPERRGFSLAGPLLATGEDHLSRNHKVTAYLAAVHCENTPSRRLFEGAHYLPDQPADGAGFLQLRKAARAVSSPTDQQ